MDLLLHKNTTEKLRQVEQKPYGTYIFSGSAGAGKFAAARQLGEKLTEAQHLLIVEPDGKSIGISQVQDLQHLIHLKLPSTKKRVVIINDAHTMTREAQNAALKILEEPPQATLFILITHLPHNLLPTVCSRAQELRFEDVNAEAVQKYLVRTYGLREDQAHRLYALGQKSIGRSLTLLENKEELAAISSLRKLTHEFNKNDLFEQLTVDSKIYDNASASLEIILNSLRGQIRKALEAQQFELALRLNRALKKALGIIGYLKANGNSKLALDIMALELMN